MIVFISGPITGHADYREEFRQAEDLCRLLGYKFITPRPLEQLVSDPDIMTHDDWMDLTFRLMDKADAVVQLRGWRESPGACMEYGYAMAKDMIIMGIDVLEEAAEDGPPHEKGAEGV